MDTQNDGLEKVVPLKYGHVGYPCSISGGVVDYITQLNGY